MFLVSYAIWFNFYSNEPKISSENKPDIKLYQGPVPQGYDEKYFRETGITKPLENK